ncbi:MAG: bifunctional oligoribonuclease/PAP phosphatase NrnA [Alicyclobacillus mali]|uniref:DHH family phosphoesterase n=1 Tax=Alicyclobacillus mali (ex Roth et al. 2021) TaxID=1123961 RepID=UPI001A8ECE85|nr:bifunctional oligoribonuclease/PAP phosphatase NrnA [Alicyclobacillus mali (ex Roth et al. 2021)]MCL6488768.1 bifunctional oligoribonuclease/PAP phosphatase NrnA [Alicyclobacillus mali (ex Roth et al. 2021)]
MTSWQPEPRDKDAIARTAEALRGLDDWLIVTHERPDGDALGSALAVAHMLDALGKRFAIAAGEALPPRFRFLPMYDRVQALEDLAPRRFQHIVAVDCADEQRFAPVAALVATDPLIVNIDHHQTNPRYGWVACVDPLAAATCEVLYHVARALDVPLNVDLAKCLYTGILTDTGGFSYPNTTREVHQIAAELLASGVQPYDIAEPALEARTLEQMRLLQIALREMTIAPDGRYAFILVSQEMLASCHASEDDVEGLVGFARSVETVEVGVLLRERPDGLVKASLRSKRRVDVAAIAQQFGGGGHARAAGCVLKGTLAEAKLAVESAVIAALREVDEACKR